MNQGKLEVVKQEMARVNIDILEISVGNAFLLSVSFIATLHQLDKLPFYSLLMSFYWEWVLGFVIFLWHLYR